MRKIVEIRNFSTPANQEYIGTAYPGPGIYKNEAGWWLVYQLQPTGSLCVINLGTGYSPPIPMEDYVEEKLESKPDPGIQASDLLKAIAISQNPLLAKELLK